MRNRCFLSCILKGTLQGSILFRRNRDFAMQQADEIFFFQAGDAAVNCFDARADFIGNLLTVLPQDK